MEELRMRIWVNIVTDRVIFAEVNQDVVNFFLGFLVIPISGVADVVLTRGRPTTGSYINLYNNIRILGPLGPDFLQPEAGNITKLSHQAPLCLRRLFSTLKAEVFYLCGCCYGTKKRCRGVTGDTHFCLNSARPCPSCDNLMSKAMTPLPPPSGRFVKEGQYLLLDNMEMRPATTTLAVALAGNYQTEQREVVIRQREAEMLLRRMLESKTVLTDVFVTEKE